MLSPNKNHAQLFGRIRLHGLTRSGDGAPCPVDLERRTSFPMPTLYHKNELHNDNVDLSPLSLAPIYDIEARVCFDRPIKSSTRDPELPKGALGAGRAGTVYPLEILSFKHATSQASANEDLVPPNVLAASSQEPLEPPTIPPLCVKIATPGYCRSLAREAWFYEQFDAKGLTGLITPRCYGVFHTSNIPNELTIDIPEYDYYKTKPIYDSDSESSESSESTSLYTACLPEEIYEEGTNTLSLNTYRFMDDMKNSYTKSEWTQFRETPEVTTMTVLIMDMLGRRMTSNDFKKDWRGDLKDIFYDHLYPLNLTHDDVCFRNLVRVPSHLQVPCPMHPNAVPGHKWNIIDWEAARKLSPDMRAGFIMPRLDSLYHCYTDVTGHHIDALEKDLWNFYDDQLEICLNS